MLNTRGIKTRKGSATRRTPVAVGVVISVCLAISVLLVARGGVGGWRVQLRCRRKRRAGVRDRLGSSCSSVSHQFRRKDPLHAVSRLARRPPVSKCSAGERVPGSPDLRRRKIGTAHGAHGRGGTMGSEHLQPKDLGQRLPVPDHPRRDEARHRRAPADRSCRRAWVASRHPLAEGPTDYLPPYPTLIEYSGYGYADPAGPENGIAILANLMGFAVVDVNMRGTGCSGGAFNFFEPLQNLDGYDVIETIAHQPWVLDHKVGMMGISYGAISQLFVVAARSAGPRGHLAALDDRCDSVHAVSRGHPEHRLRSCLGRTAARGRRAGRA